MGASFDPEEYNYQVWCDAYEKQHLISSMPCDYIKRCMDLIKKGMPSDPEQLRVTWDGHRPIRIGDIGSDIWCGFYGKGYLRAFETELRSRKRKL